MLSFLLQLQLSPFYQNCSLAKLTSDPMLISQFSNDVNKGNEESNKHVEPEQTESSKKPFENNDVHR